MAEGARLESVYTRKCIEGSNPSLTAKFEEKAWIHVQAFFFAWCTAERGEKPRQGSTKRLRFGPPTAARRVSAANQALSHRQIRRESLDSRPGFFFLHGAQPRGVCTAPLPTLCDRDSHFRRLPTNLTPDVLALSWLPPCRSPQFSAKCAQLERTNKNTEIILDRIGPTPYSSAPLQR